MIDLLCNSPSTENYRFPGEIFTWRKRVTRLELVIYGMRRDRGELRIEGELPGKASNSVNRVTRPHINRPLRRLRAMIKFNFQESKNT